MFDLTGTQTDKLVAAYDALTKIIGELEDESRMTKDLTVARRSAAVAAKYDTVKDSLFEAVNVHHSVMDNHEDSSIMAVSCLDRMMGKTGEGE